MTVSALPLVAPRYRRSPKARVYVAHFPGSTLNVENGRARCYPGLAGDAPDLRSLYLAAAELLAPARSIVDLGCGAGIGCAQLAPHFEHISALDSDGVALEFAREYLGALPHVDVLLAPSTPVDAPRRHDAGCVVDVLGHTSNPVELLRSARRWIKDDGRLFLAEPRAYPTQALLPPVLRAFSRPALSQLLVRAGWEVESWLDEVGHFVACLARPSQDDGWVWLERGDQARRAGNQNAALEAYAQAAACGSIALGSEALLGSAEIHAERGGLDAACRCLLDAARNTPEHVRALAGIAEVSLFSGEARRALLIAVQALESDPCDLHAVQALARAAHRLEQPEAVASWRLANGLAPADLASAIELARMSAVGGKLEFAIWVLERVRGYREDLPADFHVTLAWLYTSSGAGGEARLEAELARVKEPTSLAVAELLAHLGAVDGVHDAELTVSACA
ncbi:MAG TPA: methyltransferase domain-containing protein [Polyangiaceae bacterium]|nr:methyltransferase domain-containing protein [Polyangiaceae bacterium]